MNIDLKYTLKKTVELLAIPSPVGYTHMAIEWVRKELESLGVKKYNITKKGALIAYVKGKDSNYKKMISAHVDTLGAVVKKVKKNGRLEITNAGGFAWGSVEGENVTIDTLSEKTYTGTILPIKASVHVYGDAVREMPRTEETMEVRIDEDVKTAEDVFKLGILQGDFISFDPRTRVLENGYIKSRHLDDKLCVAQILTYLKYLKDNKLKPKTDLYIYFSNYEENGHGVSVFPEDLDEFIAVDIGLVAGEDAHGDEKKVNITAKDSKTSYDYTLRKKLQEAADKNKIQYTIAVHNRYSSDATAAISQGFDFKYACIGPNVDATHHYERCHNDGIVETIKLLIAYL